MTSEISPYLAAAQKRIEAAERAKFPWEAHTVYEPAPLPRSYGKSRAERRFWRIVIALGILAVIGGALAGWNS